MNKRQGDKQGLTAVTLSDMGRKRTNNEDLGYVDPEGRFFLVIDGVGGHAAGETAAATALEVIRERLERESGTPEQRLREAIALANNEIFRLASTNPEWNGMACVLTVALVVDGVVHVGHVGDSRLYLLTPGSIKKITKDHSPVGEREDRGELSEVDAMRHPRRNEIFRDVGSAERTPDDQNFIDSPTSFPMPPDGALLLCSDGLTDLVEEATIAAGMEMYAPDYGAAIKALIRAANDAGGKDNITITVAAAPGYGKPDPSRPPAIAMPTPIPHAAQPGQRPGVGWLTLAGVGLACMVFGGLGVAGWTSRAQLFGPVQPVEHVAQLLRVEQGGRIEDKLRLSQKGDTVLISPGEYSGRVYLRAGVAVRGDESGPVVLTAPDAGPVVRADNVVGASLQNVTIRGVRSDAESSGIEIVAESGFKCDVRIENVRVENAYTGIVVQGAATPKILRSRIVGNLATGLEIQDSSAPVVEGNIISGNGKAKPGPQKPGIDVGPAAKPILRDNAVFDNGAEPIWIDSQPEHTGNFFGGPPPARTHKLKSRAAKTEGKSPMEGKSAMEGKSPMEEKSPKKDGAKQ